MTAPDTAARRVIGAAIIREYELADPDDQGFRPEAFALAGAVLNALAEAGYDLTGIHKDPATGGVRHD